MSSPTSPAPGSPASPSFAVSSPADILSYVPHALGFMPGESLVVLTTAGKRLGATLRVDLPPDGTDPVPFAEGVMSFLQGDSEADGALVVVYTEEDWRELTPPPRAALVRCVEAVLGAGGLPVRGGWFVSPSGWRDYFCSDGECCPWPGRPLGTVVHSALNAELIFGGSSFDVSAPEAVLRAAPSIAAPGAASPAALRAVEDAQAHYAACCSGHWTAVPQFRATSALWDAVLLQPEGFGVEAEPEVAGFLLASIESRTVRDFLLASACLGSFAALDGAARCGLLEPDPAAVEPDPAAVRAAVEPDRAAVRAAGSPADFPAWVLPEVRTEGGLRSRVRAADAGLTASEGAGEAGTQPSWDGRPEETALLYADVLAGRYTGAIEWRRVDAMSVILARIAAVSDGESRAAALTMSAWFEYARGRGSRAAVFLIAAEEAVPGYRLARLLHELLRRGGLPAWARHRSTAWTSGVPAAPRSAGHGRQARRQRRGTGCER